MTPVSRTGAETLRSAGAQTFIFRDVYKHSAPLEPLQHLDAAIAARLCTKSRRLHAVSEPGAVATGSSVV